MLISSVLSASNLPMAGGFIRKAEISSAVVLSRPCGMMVFGVIHCYVLGGKLGLEEGKPDQSGGPEGWNFNRNSLNSSGDIAHGPNHWGCCCLKSDDSVCNSVDVCRIHIAKGRRIGQLQTR